MTKRPDTNAEISLRSWALALMVRTACRYNDGTASGHIGREQAARLAAILPARLKRRPQSMNYYSARVLEWMGQMGW